MTPKHSTKPINQLLYNIHLFDQQAFCCLEIASTTLRKLPLRLFKWSVIFKLASYEPHTCTTTRWLSPASEIGIFETQINKILTPNYIWKEQKNSSYSQVIRGEPFTSGISEYFAESEAVCVRNSCCCTVKKNNTSVFHCYEILVLLETLSLSTFICKIKCKFEQYGVNYKWYILTNERVGRKFDLWREKFWITCRVKKLLLKNLRSIHGITHGCWHVRNLIWNNLPADSILPQLV